VTEWAASIALVLCLQAQIAIVRPEFTARQIGPTGGWLWPGRMFTIYGKHLGPADPCVRDTGPFRPDGPNSAEVLGQVERTLPVALCGVQVLMDEQPVPLIYVHEQQIDFVVPGFRPFGKKVMVRVVRGALSSIPVALKFGPDAMSLYQDEPAYAGMAVWVRLYKLAETKTPVELPFGISLFWSPECPSIEIKYDGVPLPKRRSQNTPRRIAYSGPPCPTLPLPDRRSLAGRIPLHLWYDLQRPGTYFARYVPGSGLYGAKLTAETEWTRIEVKAASLEDRRKWISEKAASAPTDVESLLYEFLPSIFGYSDAEALEIGLPYLYHQHASVAHSTAGYLRNYYAASTLVPALQRLERQRGKNQIVSDLLGEIGVHPVER
jgi:hypothetical protein